MTPKITLNNPVLCISWIIKCLIIIDARCKYEENKEEISILYFVHSQMKA